MAKSLMDNIGEQGTLGVLQNMSSSDAFNETSRYIQFKAALRQVFPVPSSKSNFYAPEGIDKERTEGPPIRGGWIAEDDNTTGEVHVKDQLHSSIPAEGGAGELQLGQ